MKISHLLNTIRILTSMLSTHTKLKSYKEDTQSHQQEEYPLGAELRPYVALA